MDHFLRGFNFFGSINDEKKRELDKILEEWFNEDEKFYERLR
jgi:hypothetical protein